LTQHSLFLINGSLSFEVYDNELDAALSLYIYIKASCGDNRETKDAMTQFSAVTLFPAFQLADRFYQ